MVFGEEAPADKRIRDDIVNLLLAAVEEIYTGGLAKITLNLRGGIKASISQTSKGEINVERMETKKTKINRVKEGWERNDTGRYLPEIPTGKISGQADTDTGGSERYDEG